MSIFTQDYFSNNIPIWDNLFSNCFQEQESINCLEVGCLEGRATLWLLENPLSKSIHSRITCVDTFKGTTGEHDENTTNGLLERFLHNISPHKNKVRVIKGFSAECLKHEAVTKEKYDFIYIDAAHRARNVLEDAILSFPLLKIGGVMIFDDYGPNKSNTHSLEFPRYGIECFLACYSETYHIIHSGYQLIIQKTHE